MIALLRTKRWLGYLGLAVLFALVCSGFGTWQVYRRAEAVAAIERLNNNYDRPAVPVAGVLESTEAFHIDQQWTPVELTGRYLVDEQVLLRSRVRDTQIGFDVVTPFLTDDGTIFYVDRGWLAPGDSPDSPVTEPATPTGDVTITARLRPNEGALTGRGAPEGQIASVDLPVLAADFDEPVYTGAYGLLEAEGGVAPTDVAVAERPVLDEGPHLSYTLQWFVFALMGLFGYWWALRKEARSEAGFVTVKKMSRDVEEEDALIDRSEAELESPSSSAQEHASRATQQRA